MDENKSLPVLIHQTDQYFVFCELEVLPFGQYFAETLEELFEISSDHGKVIFEVLCDSNLPVVRVSNSFVFKGKQNNWEGKLFEKAGSLGMTYFLQKHLVFLLSNSKDFKNKDLLDGLIQSSSNIKNTVETKLDNSEAQALYYFWD